MKPMIIPASNNELLIVKIGNNWVHPSVKDMESIRDWVVSRRDNWLPERKKLKHMFGYNIKIQAFPILKSTKEYVWLIKNSDEHQYFYTEEDVQSWRKAFDEQADDPDFVLFVWGGLTIQRISKILIPFL
jgi:hypothetical protein